MRRSIPLSLALVGLASCVPQARPPAPAPVRAVALPPVIAPPVAEDWRDWPVTPGDWRYGRDGTGSIARFGTAGTPPLMTLRCDPAVRQVALTVRGSVAAATVRTSSATRTLTMAPDGEGASRATLAASDPLLDAMGFSRGHFAVEAGGRPVLVVPAWAEIERVTQDCR